MLAVYALLAAHQMTRAPPSPDFAGIHLADQARLAAARIDGQFAGVRAALTAGKAAADRPSSRGQDDADLALRAAGAGVSGIAIVKDAVTAQSGAGADWTLAAAASRASGKPFWMGGLGPWIYAAVQLDGSGQMIAAIKPAQVLPAGAGTPFLFLTAPDGRVLEARGPDGVVRATTLGQAVGVSSANLAHGQAQGRLEKGAPVRLAAQPAAGGALLVVTGRAGTLPPATAPHTSWELITTFGPLAIGGLLTLLLMLQSRHARMAQRAFSDTEQRFRLAVEAARCGIWEWDLKTDRVFMSDVTGAILGWGGGGVVEGGQVLDRIAPDHRDRVQQALARGAQLRRLRRLVPGA